VIELNEMQRMEMDSIVKNLQEKYQKMLQNEQLYKEYDNYNEDSDNYTRGSL